MGDTKGPENANETWTEDLPKPPIPSLESTIFRYLAALEPVIPSQQYEQTTQTAHTFVHSGEGERLQELLGDYAERSDNWMTDFWLDDMYLNNPIPLVVNSNPFFLLPKQDFKTTLDLIYYASVITQFALEFKQKIDRQTLQQDVGSGQKQDQKLCMQTYKNFFTACRVPSENKDELVVHQRSRHFVVAAFNQFHVVHLETDQIPSVDNLARCLYSIWNATKSNKCLVSNIGILTADNRRTWALIRKQLLKDQVNRESLDWLEKSLFVLCLDDFVTPKVPTKTGYRNSIQIAKMDLSYMASMLLHGGGSALHTPNRWFDKFLQIVVSKEGICGLLVEHSASEGITVLRFCEQFLAQQHRNTSRLVRQDSVEMQSEPGNLRTTPLHWRLDNRIEMQIKTSEKQVDKIIFDLDLYVLRFTKFGRTFIKEQRISPDVFIQLALQLTYFKVHKRVVSTYESCSLRQFRKGRVDNIRANTREALEWARCMCGEGDVSETEKINLFKRAICRQTEILKYTASGFGPDIHLVALRELSRAHFNSVPQLYKEKSFKEYINFRLSTSQLFTREDILVGYGPVVTDGYGCSYTPKNNEILFCLSSFYSSNETSSDFFALSLEGSLLQMRELCLQQTVTSH